MPSIYYLVPQRVRCPSTVVRCRLRLLKTSRLGENPGSFNIKGDTNYILVEARKDNYKSFLAKLTNYIRACQKRAQKCNVRRVQLDPLANQNCFRNVSNFLNTLIYTIKLRIEN